jgi:apolipoprotein N-acyltransferase
VQCANTGLSALIYENGEIVSQTEWWKQEVLEAHLESNDIKTFYAEHGDYIGWIATVLSIVIFIGTIAYRVGYRNK